MGTQKSRVCQSVEGNKVLIPEKLEDTGKRRFIIYIERDDRSKGLFVDYSSLIEER